MCHVYPSRNQWNCKATLCAHDAERMILMKKTMMALALTASMVLTAFPMPVTAVDEQPAVQTAVGDINGDGTADILDVIRLNKALLGIEKLTDAQTDAADTDGDGSFTSNDVLELLKSILGIEEQTFEFVAQSLSGSYQGQDVLAREFSEETVLGQTQFALDLLRNTAKPVQNSLVSPYSVSQALGMTANGAAGNTRKDMEQVLGGSMDELNPGFYSLRTRDTVSAKFRTANSIWMNEGFIQKYPISKAFLQTNADYYNADAYAAPFDETTLHDINSWVDEKTDHMIPSIIDEIPDGVGMYLIDAVVFDAEWKDPYSGDFDGKFTAANGKTQNVKMLSQETSGAYYEADGVTGFRKNYKGSAYYFAALMPEQGTTPEAYLDTLTAEELHALLANPKYAKLDTTFPAFSMDFAAKLREPLTAMGMGSAFHDEDADTTKISDFSAMFEDGKDRMHIGEVYHKTHIEVTKAGTRAGAATAVEMMTEAACIEEIVTITIDRPFLYMIVDAQTDLPLFIGIVNSVE